MTTSDLLSMAPLLGIIVAGLIYSAYNLGCIWAYKRALREMQQRDEEES